MQAMVACRQHPWLSAKVYYKLPGNLYGHLARYGYNAVKVCDNRPRSVTIRQLRSIAYMHDYQAVKIWGCQETHMVTRQDLWLPASVLNAANPSSGNNINRW